MLPPASQPRDLYRPVHHQFSFYSATNDHHNAGKSSYVDYKYEEMQDDLILLKELLFDYSSPTTAQLPPFPSPTAFFGDHMPARK